MGFFTWLFGEPKEPIVGVKPEPAPLVDPGPVYTPAETNPEATIWKSPTASIDQLQAETIGETITGYDRDAAEQKRERSKAAHDRIVERVGPLDVPLPQPKIRSIIPLDKLSEVDYAILLRMLDEIRRRHATTSKQLEKAVAETREVRKCLDHTADFINKLDDVMSKVAMRIGKLDNPPAEPKKYTSRCPHCSDAPLGPCPTHHWMGRFNEDEDDEDDD